MRTESQLFQGDCLEVMATLPDNSVGMVLADLPYGVTACHWDKVIDLDAMWVQLKRLIQPKRALVFTATQPFTTDLICSNREWFKYCWVWDKIRASNFLIAKYQPLRTHEDVLVFSNGGAATGASAPMLYNPQGCTSLQVTKKNRKTSGGRSVRSGKNIGDSNCLNKPEYLQSFTDYPKTIYRRGLDSSKLHGTQKPVALFEYLIRTYTNPGDVVLDPTAGSMTTAIAAMNTGRGYICIEKDPDEYRKGLNRVEEHLAKPQQFNLLEPTPELPPVATMHQPTLFDKREAY